MTTRKRHTPEQVVRKLTQADRLLGEGKDVADVCRELQVSEQTYYRWRNQFGGEQVVRRHPVCDHGRAQPGSGGL
jgi:putative transposase